MTLIRKYLIFLGTEEGYKNPQPDQMVSRPKFEPQIS
jgi:hypothetical protein